MAASPTRVVAQVQADKIVRFATKHYELWLEGDPHDAEEMGAVLEEAWTAFDKFFHAHPDPAKRSRVKLLADEKGFLTCAWSDGAVVPAQSRPAYWAESTSTVYAYGPPRAYVTRRVVLFGAMLQFHALTSSKNKNLQSEWYEAGLAQAFARHTWDGKTLHLMAHPRVETVDFPKRALMSISDEPSELQKLLDAALPDPVVCWSVVGMCLQGAHGRYRDILEKYALGRTGTRIPSADFLRTLGPAPQVTRDLRAWLVDEQAPLESVSEEWEDRGEQGIVGTARSGWAGFCALKDEQQDTIECTLGLLPKIGVRAGLVTGFYDLGELTTLSFVAPTLRIEIWHQGRLVNAEEIPMPGDHLQERRLKLVRKRSQALISVDGVLLATRELPGGRNGFFVEGGRAVFKDPHWE